MTSQVQVKPDEKEVESADSRSVWTAPSNLIGAVINLANYNIPTKWRTHEQGNDQSKNAPSETELEEKALGKKYDFISTTKRIFSIATEENRTEMAVRALGVVAMAGVPYYLAVVSAKIGAILSTKAADPVSTMVALDDSLLSFTAAGAVMLVATLVNSRLNARFRQFMDKKLSQEMGEALHLKQEDVESEKTKKLINTVNWNRQSITNFVDSFFLMGKDVVSCTIGAGVLLAYSPAAASIMACAGCLFAINKIKSAKDHVRTFDETSDTRQKFGHRQWYQGFPDAIRQIKLLGKEKQFAEITMQALNEVTESQLKLIDRDFKRDRYVSVTEFVAYSATFATFAYQTLLPVSEAAGGISYQAFITLTGGLLLFRQSMQNLRESVGEQLRNTVYAKRFLLVSDMAEEAKQEQQRDELPELPFDTHMPPQIVFKNVTYEYTNSQDDKQDKPTSDTEKKRPALQDFTLTIEPGQLIAICGDPGSGKTTLFDIICKLKSPGQGEITIDGFDMSVIPQGKWREYLSTHVQNFLLFSSLEFGEIAEMGTSADAKSREFWDSADLVGASFIREKDYSPETTWGVGFKNSGMGSGGQQQQMALLRAAMKVPSILILDEPTSNLGPKETDNVIAMIREARSLGATVILATHDYSVFNDLQPDKIVVLNKGVTEVMGTHVELIGGKNTYSHNLGLVRERAKEKALGGNT
jgi:ABC-type multidrug transport system fused ATPase/permease subunit